MSGILSKLLLLLPSTTLLPRNNKLQAVRTKYKGGKFLKVADLDVLKGEVSLLIAGFVNYTCDLQVINKLAALQM